MLALTFCLKRAHENGLPVWLELLQPSHLAVAVLAWPIFAWGYPRHSPKEQMVHAMRFATATLGAFLSFGAAGTAKAADGKDGSKKERKGKHSLQFDLRASDLISSGSAPEGLGRMTATHASGYFVESVNVVKPKFWLTSDTLGKPLFSGKLGVVNGVTGVVLTSTGSRSLQASAQIFGGTKHWGVAVPVLQMPYRAGQYFNVVLEGGARRAFSFATAPEESEAIEMHVRLVPGGRFTTHVFEAMKVGDVLTMEGPFGRFQLRESARPLIFVAGATGFAPVKSMLEHAFGVGLQRRMILYWGVRQRRDLYQADLAEQWARSHPNFSFVPVLSEAAAEDNWAGRTGLVHEAILQDFPDLAGFEIYTCVSVKMVEAARPAFLAQGLDAEACFADAFSVPAAH